MYVICKVVQKKKRDSFKKEKIANLNHPYGLLLPRKSLCIPFPSERPIEKQNLVREDERD